MSSGPFVNKGLPSTAFPAGAGVACGADAKMQSMDRLQYERAMKQERVYMFWSIIQNLDNLQNQLHNLDFVDHSAAIDNLMDDLVKQWMKERRHAQRE